jgi:hypothetical protein
LRIHFAGKGGKNIIENQKIDQMKTYTFLFIGLLGLSLVACQETKAVEQEEDPGNRQLGARVQAILAEENIKEAIWNPEGMELRGLPTIEVQSEEELRAVLKDLHNNAQKMKKTFDQISEVNQRRFESYQQELSACTNRRDSLAVALQYPDITYLRDTSELISYGLLAK